MVQNSPSNIRLASLLLILGGGFQAGYFTIAKHLTALGVPSLGAVFWQALGGATFFSLLCLLRGTWPAMTARYLAYHLAVAASYVIVPNFVVFLSSPFLPTGVISMAGSLSPSCTYLLVLILGMERLDRIRGTGLLLGLMGTLVLLSPSASFGGDAAVGWYFAALLLPLSFATSNVLRQRIWPENETALTLACAMMIVATAVLLPLCIATDTFYVPSELFSEISGWLLVYTLFATLYTWMAFRVVQLAGAVFLSQIGYVVALIGVGLGIIVYHERPNIAVLGAGILIFVGLSLVTRRQRDLGSAQGA